MYYDPTTGLNYERSCHIVLRDSALVAPALVELNNAALFNRRIKLEPIPSDWVWSPPPQRIVDLSRGWFASEKPDIELAKVREPLLVYPKDLFAPLRGKKSHTRTHETNTDFVPTSIKKVVGSASTTCRPHLRQTTHNDFKTYMTSFTASMLYQSVGPYSTCLKSSACPDGYTTWTLRPEHKRRRRYKSTVVSLGGDV